MKVIKTVTILVGIEVRQISNFMTTNKSSVRNPMVSFDGC